MKDEECMCHDCLKDDLFMSSLTIRGMHVS